MTPDAHSALQVLRDAFIEGHPREAARVLDPLSVADVRELLLEQPSYRGALLIDGLTLDVAAQVVDGMPREQAADLLEALDPMRAAAILAGLDESPKEELLGAVSATAAKELRELMSYPAESAGRLMDPRVLAFHPETGAGRALKRIRARLRAGGPRVHDLWLVDEGGRLVGSVPLAEVAVAPAATPLSELARPSPPSVQGVASREEVVEVLNESKRPTLPVVDFEGRLIGVIRNATLVAAAQQEIATDMLRMVGASAQERALSSVWFGVRKRLPWLNINLATAFLAAAVVGIFESTIAQFTALAVLLPVVAGQSGNTGSQALAVTMRGLALREVRIRQWVLIARKEVALGFLNGCAIAVVTAAGVYVWSGSAGLAGVIGVAMVASMSLAGLSGAAIPILLTAVGQDPAQASSIILTTVTDVVGFLSFLGLATLAMGML